MPHRFEVEDIEEKRRLVGIDDADLRERVRRLAVGDCVNVTLRAAANSSAGETVTIRITQINEYLYLGELAHRPASTALAGLCVGQPVVFSAAHIHSLARAHPGRPH